MSEKNPFDMQNSADASSADTANNQPQGSAPASLYMTPDGNPPYYYGVSYEEEKSHKGNGAVFLGGFLTAVGICLVTFMIGLLASARMFGFNLGKQNSTSSGTIANLPIPLAGDVLDDQTSSEVISKIDKLLKYINTYYVEDVDLDVLIDGAYHGIVEALGDKYATYLNEDELVDFTASSNGNYVGIGVTVMLDESGLGAFVSAVNQSGGAYEVGLQTGDVLIKAGDTELAGMTLNQMVALIRGDEGTFVAITYIRDGKEYTVDIERRALSEVAVYYTMMENQVGYVCLTEFTRVAVDQFYDALNDLNSQGMRAMVLDLRDNGGGLVDVCVDIADTMIDTGLVTYMEDKYGNRTEYNANMPGELGIPIVVLVNGNSASASELLTTCLIDYEKAIVVGTTSFGKGIVQTTFNLMDGTAVKFTTAKYFSPHGVNVQDIGITPQYVVELPEDVILARIKSNGIPDVTKDTQLQKALELLSPENIQ